MSNIQFDAPSAPPASGNSTAPYTRFLKYKSGKTPENFAPLATPEMAKAGFSYYDKEAKAAVKVENFTACIVAVLSGVTGTVRDGEYYNNYYSNLISDTRTQRLNVRQNGVEKVMHSGIYKDIKPDLPQGVGYTQFLICYIPEHKDVWAIELTSGLATAIQAAIARACNVPVSKISMFNLCELTSRFWALKFNADFVKVGKEGHPHDGKGEMYFMPRIDVFEISAAKNAETCEMLASTAQEVSDFILAGQAKLSAGDSVARPEPAIAAPTRTEYRSSMEANPAVFAPFPTQEPINMNITANHGAPDDTLPF